MYKRLDNNCEAKILADLGSELLIAAYWPARTNDNLRFQTARIDGVLTARNITKVPKTYFEKKYGVHL